MAHPHGLVQHAMTVNTVTLAGLSGRTAIDLNTVMTSITQTFLMKRIRYFLQMIGKTQTDDGPILIGLAKGNASNAEIAQALLEANSNGQDDVTQTLQQDDVWSVYQNTVIAMVTRTDGTHGQAPQGWIKFPGRGIPAGEANGFRLFVFNAGENALTTGTSINGIVHIQGVWLND